MSTLWPILAGVLAALAALLLARRQSEIAQRDRPAPTPERSDTPDADRLLRHF